MPYTVETFNDQTGVGQGDKRSALDEIGRAYKSRSINFRTAILLRDAVREGSCSSAVFALRVNGLSKAA